MDVVSAITIRPYDEMVSIEPFYDDIEPVYDGTKLIENNIFLSFVYWDKELISFIYGLWAFTPAGDFVRDSALPILFSILSLAFLAIFSRRKSPEKDPESTPAKILAYLSRNPPVSQHSIVDGLGISRGSVKYQLRRLEKEGKILTQIVAGRTYYTTKPLNTNTIEYAAIRMLDSKMQKQILLLLLNTEKEMTRFEIAEILGISADTISYHLRIMDPRFLNIRDRRNTRYYTISKDVQQILPYFQDREKP